MAYYESFGKIQKRVDELNKDVGRKVLILGYTGNLERWGDDRFWRLWVNEVRYESGNLKSLWGASAEDLDVDKVKPVVAAKIVARALAAIETFKLGLEAAGCKINCGR